MYSIIKQLHDKYQAEIEAFEKCDQSSFYRNLDHHLGEINRLKKVVRDLKKILVQTADDGK